MDKTPIKRDKASASNNNVMSMDSGRRKRMNNLPMKEINFLLTTIVLYITFLQWGYLQERLTSVQYSYDNIKDESQQPLRTFNYPYALNFLMALSAALAATLVETIGNMSSTMVFGEAPPPPVNFACFWKAALSSAMASPIGYLALNYISFPLMVLTKSSKPVPVMAIGIIFYRRTFKWYKYVGVLLLCGGIALFSTKKGGKGGGEGGSGGGVGGGGGGKGIPENDLLLSSISNFLTSISFPSIDIEAIKICLGVILVGANLALDGYTNNEQDHIFTKFGATSLQMMKNVNFWQAIILISFLLFKFTLFRTQSEISIAFDMLANSAQLRSDVCWFCLCAAVGQVLIFKVMQEYGSLVWITISITRKLFTILVSVFAFNHPVNFTQWLGITSVFTGLTLEIVMGYIDKPKSKRIHLAGGGDDKSKLE